MKDYELVYILPPTAEEEQTASTVEAITAWVQSLKGEVQEVKGWGRRRFSYPIKQHREGNYVEMHFKLDPAATTELERGLRLNESVIRHMLISKDDR